MPVRTTMAALISRVRLLINDPAGVNQQFADQDIQDVMDESRVDYKNLALTTKPTFSGTTIQYLDYWAPLGGWEDGYVLKQFLTTPVTPSQLEPIAGRWVFATTTLPPVFLSGTVHDVYRSAADLLERLAARWVLAYNFTSDGQSFQRSQAQQQILSLAQTYRRKQRPIAMSLTRSDLAGGKQIDVSLGPTEIDYMGSG